MPNMNIVIKVNKMTSWELFRCKFWLWMGNEKKVQKIILAYLDREFGK